MTVAYDSNSSATGTSTTSMSWTHNPVGTLRAVILYIVQNIGTTDEITSVDYGGVAMHRVGMAIQSSGETGVVYCYFLGSGIPSGSQTVTVNVNGTGSAKMAVVSGLTAAADTEVVTFIEFVNSTSQANPTGTIRLSSRTCFVDLGLHSGIAAIASITPSAGWTSRNERVFSAATAGRYTYNTISNADVTVGWTQAADDALGFALAVSEVAAMEEVIYQKSRFPRSPRTARQYTRRVG